MGEELFCPRCSVCRCFHRQTHAEFGGSVGGVTCRHVGCGECYCIATGAFLLRPTTRGIAVVGARVTLSGHETDTAGEEERGMAASLVAVETTDGCQVFRQRRKPEPMPVGYRAAYK